MVYHQGAEEDKFSSEDCVLLYQASLVLSFLSLLQPNSRDVLEGITQCNL